MEASISCAASGKVERLAIAHTQQVEAGDLLLVIAP
jgi:pyruvate carboxylase